MWIADVSIRRPVFVVMMIGALATLGWISLGRLGIDLFPRVEFPYMTVTTVLEGATPETIENEVTDVIEENVNTIAGIKTLTSVSSEGLSQVFIEFELQEDVDIVAQDVREKVALARRDLPIDAEPPIVEKIDPDAAPILSVMVSGDVPIRDLTRFADDVVKERIQRIPGVGSATLIGGRDREIRIWIDGPRLRSYGLTVSDVQRALRSEHAEIPGGRLDTQGRYAEFSVKTKGEVASVGEFADIVVAYRDGKPTLLRDVARVEDGIEDERTYAEFNGVRGVSIEVRRQSGRNTVEVARQIRAAAAELTANAPPGFRVVVARDVARFIESSARDVAVDMTLGGILAVLVTFAFLRSLRSTLIVSIAIPTSIISTFFLFYVMDFTINMLTLMALSVSIGLLIDDAIVILESIQRRIEAGDSPLSAASKGTSEVSSAVLAGSASVLAVFVPIAFMEGLVGQFFYEYGMAISFAIAVSLLVALTATPMFCSRVLRSHATSGRTYRVMEALYTGLERAYGWLLRGSLRHRVIVLTVAIASVYAGLQLARQIPLGFISHVDRSECLALFELPLGVGIERTKEVGHRVAQRVADLPDVKSVFLTIGSGSQSRVSDASLYITMTPKRERERDHLLVMADIRRVMLEAAPEARRLAVNEMSWVSGGGFSSYPIEYIVQGPELAELERVSEEILSGVRASRLFVDPKSTWETGKPEVQVLVNRRRVADLGVPVRELASTVRALVGGVDVATYEEAGSRYDVRLRLEEDQRDDLDKLGRIQVRSVGGQLIDLSNLATLRIARAPARIDRQDRVRKISLLSNTPAGVALGTATDEFDRIVASVNLAPGYVGRYRGMAERMKDTADAILIAFVFALLALYMILGSQFNSFVQPGVIMLTAPLAFVGAFAALAFTGSELSMFAQIGLIALMGLVMKNGILLVDCANQRRAEGLDARTAVLRAGSMRLRPVLMTAFSTIFGMLPVAVSQSDASEWRSPMGIIVIGGLLSSTFLTLLVVPVAYTLVDDVREMLRRLSRRSGAARTRLRRRVRVNGRRAA